MQNTDYILAFESILYGLIVSKILVKWSEMIREKSKAVYWAYPLLTINVFLLVVHVFWANSEGQHFDVIETPLDFLLRIVAPPALFTFMTYEMFPSRFKNTNQKTFLLQNRNKIFIPIAIYTAFEVLTLDDPKFSLYTLCALISIILAGIIIRIKSIYLVSAFVIFQSLILALAYLRAYIF